jgi:hypothetical protein
VVFKQGIVTRGRIGCEMEYEIWTNLTNNRFDIREPAHVSMTPRARTRNSDRLDTLAPKQFD